MSDLSYLLTHPPRCLSGFVKVALPDGLLDVAFDGHGEDWNPVFALSCRCGNAEFKLTGFSVIEPEYSLFLSPIEATCTSCGDVTPVLDTDVHGYDAELGHGSTTRRAEGNPCAFHCPRCSSDRGSLFMRFEFAQDLFDSDFDTGSIEKQDLFTWVSCVSQCSNCSRQNLVSDFECA
jgi:hypothetical protein